MRIPRDFADPVRSTEIADGVTVVWRALDVVSLSATAPELIGFARAAHDLAGQQASDEVVVRMTEYVTHALRAATVRITGLEIEDGAAVDWSALAPDEQLGLLTWLRGHAPGYGRLVEAFIREHQPQAELAGESERHSAGAPTQVHTGG